MRDWRSLTVASLTLIAACSKAPEPAPIPTPTPFPAQATPSPIPAAVQIRSLEIGRAIGPDKRVTDATASFRPSDTIYVAVLTDGSAPATQVKARFVYGPDGQLVNESTQTIATVGPAVTEFHVAKPDGWPVGTYAVEVSLAGAASQRVEFKVE